MPTTRSKVKSSSTVLTINSATGQERTQLSHLIAAAKAASDAREESDPTHKSLLLQMESGRKWVCLGLTTAAVAAIVAWNQKVGLDLVTMVLSLLSMIYVWTNG